MSEETVRQGPIDLSQESDFSLGALQISPSTREVVRDGQRETLEPKATQVLVALHQAMGRVVSRDELIARCWDGRIVGEDAINRVIWRLRRLSEADAIFTIETIAKVGYRLQLPARNDVSSAASQPMASDTLSILPSPANSPEPASLLVRYRLGAAGAVLLFIGGVMAWFLWPARHWTVESSRPFISTLALEGEPAFSPDGKMLAYTSGADTLSRKIYVRNVAGGDGIRITNDGYDDTSPSWSSDGVHVAYIARKPGEPCRIMVTSVPAGESREVGRCARAQSTLVSWQPGTSYLYYFDRAGTFEDSVFSEVSIFRLDLDNGALLELPKRSPVGSMVAIRRLETSPDGKSLLYVRGRSASTEAMVIRDLASKEEKILGTLVGDGQATWSEDSRTVMASTANGIGSQITAYPVNGDAPYRVYTTTINVSNLAAGAGGLLALETDTSRHNLARTRPEPAVQPDIIDPANGKTWAPTFAPDGTLAFLSNRSGNNAIWVMKPGAVPAVLFDAGLAPLFRLQYSPDGTRLVVVTAGEMMNIKVLTAGGGTVASFNAPTIGYGNPTWTPDGKAVTLLDLPTRRLVRVSIDNPVQRIPVTATDDPWAMLASHGNNLYSVRMDKGGIWQYGSAPRLINSKYPRGFSSPVTFRGDDVLIPEFDAADGARILSQPLAGGPDRVLGYAPGAEAQERFFEGKMAVNPKSGEVIYVAAVQGDTNIDLLTLTKH